MRFRSSPLKVLRKWMDEALRAQWPWGKMLSLDLDKFELRALWDEFLPRIDAASPQDRDALLRDFKRKVHHAVTEVDERANKADLF
jgi:hypothetical protein